jgi:hypothetical protein
MSSDPKTPRFLDTAALAVMLSVPDGSLRYWRKVGVGPAWVKFEGTIRYDLRDVEVYVEQCRQQPSVRAHVEEAKRAL